MAAHDLLGKSGDGNLVLLAGPDWGRMLDLVESSGLRYTRAAGLTDAENVAALKEEIADRNETVVALALMPEVEGRLDRSSFGRNLISLAYGADRIVYAGPRAAILIWPEPKGTQRTVRDGNVVVRQNITTVAAGESIVGIKADRL